MAMQDLDHGTHQVRRGQADKGNQAGLRDRRTRGQRQHDDQYTTQPRQRQAQAGGRVFAQGQGIQYGTERPADQQAEHPGRGHHPARLPADETGTAQHEGLHGQQHFGLQHRNQLCQRAQHDADHHASEQKTQRVADATRQRQRQQNGQHRAEERRARETHPHRPGQGKGCAPGEQQGHGDTQRGAGRTAQQERVCQRVAEQALRDGTRQPEQGTCQPGTERARRPDVGDDLHGVGVTQHCLHTLQPGAADAQTQQQQHGRYRQQAQHHDPDAAARTNAPGTHGSLSSTQRTR